MVAFLNNFIQLKFTLFDDVHRYLAFMVFANALTATDNHAWTFLTHDDFLDWASLRALIAQEGVFARLYELLTLLGTGLFEQLVPALHTLLERTH